MPQGNAILLANATLIKQARKKTHDFEELLLGKLCLKWPHWPELVTGDVLRVRSLLGLAHYI